MANKESICMTRNRQSWVVVGCWNVRRKWSIERNYCGKSCWGMSVDVWTVKSRANAQGLLTNYSVLASFIVLYPVLDVWFADMSSGTFTLFYMEQNLSFWDTLSWIIFTCSIFISTFAFVQSAITLWEANKKKNT